VNAIALTFSGEKTPAAKSTDCAPEAGRRAVLCQEHIEISGYAVEPTGERNLATAAMSKLMLRRIRSEEIEILQVIRISAKLLRLTSFRLTVTFRLPLLSLTHGLVRYNLKFYVILSSSVKCQQTAALDPDCGSSCVQALEHIVVLMMENRSFDHMLGFLVSPQWPVSPERTNSDIHGVLQPITQNAQYQSQLNPDHT